MLQRKCRRWCHVPRSFGGATDTSVVDMNRNDTVVPKLGARLLHSEADVEDTRRRERQRQRVRMRRARL